LTCPIYDINEICRESYTHLFLLLDQQISSLRFDETYWSNNEQRTWTKCKTNLSKHIRFRTPPNLF